MNPPSPGARVRRLLKAPPERVFAAFSQPSLVAQWLRPSPDVKLTVLDFDFQPGGSYRFAYDVPDGRRMVVGGVYQVIERPSRLQFSWLIEPPDEHAGIDSEVEVVLTPEGSGTELVIRHTRWEHPEADRRHALGWQGALVLLDGILGEAR